MPHSLNVHRRVWSDMRGCGGLGLSQPMLVFLLPFSVAPLMPRLIYYPDLQRMIPLLVVYKYQDILGELVTSRACLVLVA